MNGPRSRRHWWLFALLILAVQIGLIFWLSDYSSQAVRRTTPGPSLHLVSASSNELFALNDPTLFALPHPHGFSGLAWLSMTPVPYRSFQWTSELEWLSLPVSQLGAGLAKFLQTNRVETAYSLASPDPQLVQPPPASLASLSQKSRARVEGDLRARKLLSSIDPPSWQHNDLLTNTVIEMVVGEDGLPISCKALPPGSGSPEADQEALRLARTARFESRVQSGPRRATNLPPVSNLTWGRMVFTWRTLPRTNAP